VTKHRKQKKYIQNLEGQISELKTEDTEIMGQTVEDKLDGIQFTVNPMYASYHDKHKQEKLRLLMETIAKRKLAEQKMLIERDQLKKDVTTYQQELNDYQMKIDELQDEFNVEYAPDELNSSKMGIDDGYSKQNMLKEKTKMMEDESDESDEDNSGSEVESDEDSEESSEKKDRKTMKKELMQ